jgi:6-pyruvoyl-tetrahydropterin synthase related domain
MLDQLRRRLDVNLITVILIAVIAALPFLTRSGLPRHTDLELHVFRAAEYGEVLRAGVLYPRWAPDFYYGYGYPIFNYYAPLTYALANLFAIPFGIVAGVKGVILTAYLLAALGMYGLARRHFGSTAGVLASAAFVLSPYFLFIDPLMRGDLAEFFALSLLPWLFYVFDQPATMLNRRQALRALVLAALIFSHNLIALIGAGMLVIYLVWRGLFIDGPRRWRSDVVAIALVVGLTAIFWLPFFVERSAIRLDVAGPGHFDYHNHFIPLSMLLSPSPALDFGATTPKFVYNLGLIQWLLFIPALVLGILRHKTASGKVTLFFAISTLLLVFLVLPASEFLWNAIPASAYIQFPWRFLGPASFALAMGVGAVVKDEGGRRKDEGLESRSQNLVARSNGKESRYTHYVSRITCRIPHQAFLIIVFSALLVAALPTMYSPLWNSYFGDTSPRGMIDFELSGVALGTTSTGDFQPVQVGQFPQPPKSLLDSYASGQIDKFDYSTLPASRGASVQVEQHSASTDRFQVETPIDFEARLLTFYFPGWHVSIDGREVPIQTADQSGFIAFSVPAGSHVIEAALQLTTPQIVGTLISLAALFGLIVLVVIKQPTGAAAFSLIPSFSPSLLLAVSIIFFATRLIVVDRCDSCFRYTSPAGQVSGAQYTQAAHLGGHIDLLGYDLPSLNVEAGQALPLTLYWRATAPVPVNYQVFAHLTRPDTVLWGQSDKLNPGDFPTTRWPLDKYVWDDHLLRVLPGTPPGDYRISIGLYTLDNGQRAPVFDAAGQIVGDSVTLNTLVHVTRPAAAPTIALLNMQGVIDRDYNGAHLLGWSIESTQLVAPNFARLTLFWRSDADRLPNQHARVELIDRAGRVAQAAESNLYPMAEWTKSEIVRDQDALWLPPNFPPDGYTVRVQVMAEDDTTLDTLDLSQIEVKGK